MGNQGLPEDAMDKWIRTWIKDVRVHLKIQIMWNHLGAQGCSSERLVTSWLKFKKLFFHVLSIKVIKFHSKNQFPCRNIQKFSFLFLSIAVHCSRTTIHTSSTAQGGGGSFKNRKPIGRVGCCDSRMAERTH